MRQPRAFFNAIGTGYNFVAMGGISGAFYGDGYSAIDANNTVEKYDLRFAHFFAFLILILLLFCTHSFAFLMLVSL